MGNLNIYEVLYIKDEKGSQYTINVMAPTPEVAIVDGGRWLKANIFSLGAEIIGVNRSTKNVIYYKTPAAKPRKR
jgi:hypothetical protein